MRLRTTFVLGVTACLLSTAPAAQAVDWCFDSGGLTFVAKRFRIPARGQCRSFEGQQQATATITHGLACMRSDGTALRVQTTTTQLNPPNIEWDHYDLAYPALTGSVRVMGQNFAAGLSTQATFVASAAPCSPSNVPVQ